jgi:uncharacterized protein (DUF697 family)/GTP-binding protein EngB required for normal cell division
MSNFAIPTDGLKEKFNEAYELLKKQIQRPNILILGQTGVGKSSLINTIFGKQLAAVSNVKSTTRGFHAYSSEDVPVNIIDSEGYELSDCENFKSLLSEYIDQNFSDITKQIHIAWYCISISSARVLPYDLDNISFLIDEKKIPTCVVLTQCDNDTPEGDVAKALTESVTKRFGRRVKCFQTSYDPEINKELEVDKLIEWSMNNLNNDNLKLGFLIAQTVDLSMKEEKALTRIKFYDAGAAAIGASPIPMSDAALLMPLQVMMASDIFRIMGLSTNVSAAISNVIESRLISMLGKLIAGNLIKLIPFIGPIAGATINASVALFITHSLGYALVKLTKKAIENEWNGNSEMFNKVFTEENFQKYIDEYKNKGGK